MSLYALTQERLADRLADMVVARLAGRLDVKHLPHEEAARMALILREVAGTFDVSERVMRARGRQKGPVTRAQFRFMRLAYEAGFSAPKIGRYLGGRDHTTVMYGIRKDRERHP